MARQGYRVGVIDADMPSPGIHTLFGIDDEHMGKALNDFLWGRCDIEKVAYNVSACLRENEADPTKGDIYLIPSSVRAGDLTRVLREGYNVELLNDALSALIDRLNLDYLFIDTHPGLNEETLLSVAISDLLIVILRLDYQDFQGTAVTIDVARKLNVPDMVLVVNKVPFSYYDFVGELRRHAADEIQQQVEEVATYFENRRRDKEAKWLRQTEELENHIEETYGVAVAAILPLSEGVARLQSADLFSLRVPDHPFSQGIRDIAAIVRAAS
jgi:MinD-like ATPase involved in chromosome partitioning or flagellar assembly